MIRWNRSTEMVMLQNLTGGQLWTRFYDTVRFLIFIARKNLGRTMIRRKCLWFVIIYQTRSLNPHLQNYILSYGTKYKKCHKTVYKVTPQWDFVAWPFLQIGSILSQTTLPYRDLADGPLFMGSLTLCINEEWIIIHYVHSSDNFFSSCVSSVCNLLHK